MTVKKQYPRAPAAKGMRQRVARKICMAVALAFCLPGCTEEPSETTEQRKPEGPPAQATSTLDEGMSPTDHNTQMMARVDDQVITAEDLRACLRVRPLPEHVADMNAAIRDRLEEVLIRELLYREAVHLGIDHQPQVRQQIQGIVAQVLLQQMVEAPVHQTQITEAELRRYYEEHRSDFSRPEQCRLGDIFVAAAASLPAVEREKKKERAKAILAEALAGKAKAFSELIRHHSDQPEAHRKGDTGFFDVEGRPVGLHDELITAAFSLDSVGQILDRVVETPDGFHVVMLAGRRAAVEQPLDQVRNQILQKVYQDKLARARKAYIQTLWDQADVGVNEQALTEMSKGLTAEHNASFPAGPLR